MHQIIFNNQIVVGLKKTGTVVALRMNMKTAYILTNPDGYRHVSMKSWLINKGQGDDLNSRNNKRGVVEGLDAKQVRDYLFERTTKQSLIA